MGAGAFLGAAGNIVGGLVQGGFDAAAQARYEDLLKREEAAVPDVTADQLKIGVNQAQDQADVGFGDTRSAQLAALQQLQGIGAQGGMDPQSMYALQQANDQANQQTRAQQQALQQRMRMQGMGSSGQNIALQQQAAQSASNGLHSNALQTAADARTRALQAIMAGGQMAGSIRGADEGNKFGNLQARDARNQFNAGMRNSAAQFNSNAVTRAQNAQINKMDQQANAVNGIAGQYNKSGADWNKTVYNTGKAAAGIADGE